MTTTIYKAPPGMVFMSEADLAELCAHRAIAAGKSAYDNDSLPPYGKWVLVKHGKNGRVHIARRVKRVEHRDSKGNLFGISMFETRNRECLIGINLWTEIPR